jgi:hypothetical protein
MAGRLKPLDVEREEKLGKYTDGDGLYLIVAAPAIQRSEPCRRSRQSV